MSILIDFVEKLVVPHEKTASGLELEAFDALLAQADEEEKVAYGMMGGGSDDWLSRFQHTPLYEKAIALKEKDLALEKRRMEERQRREKAYRHDDSTWNEQDKLCLEKDKLTLELHKWRASQEAKAKMAAALKVAGNGDPLREKMKRLGQLKKAELVEYTGHVNNGEPQAPEWPRAALGVDAANRRATPEELRTQTSVQSPDIQHVEPHSDGSDFSKKVSGLVVKLAKEGEKGMFGVKHPLTYGVTHMIHMGDVPSARESLKALQEHASFAKRVGGGVLEAHTRDVETLKEYIANHSKKKSAGLAVKRASLKIKPPEVVARVLGKTVPAKSTVGASQEAADEIVRKIRHAMDSGDVNVVSGVFGKRASAAGLVNQELGSFKSLLHGGSSHMGDVAKGVVKGKAGAPPIPAAALAKKRGPMAAANEALVARYGAGKVPAHLVTV